MFGLLDRYRKGELSRVTEGRFYILALDSKWGDPANPLADTARPVSAAKPVLHLLQESWQTVEATGRPDAFVIASGQNGRGPFLRIRNFDPGSSRSQGDKIAFLDQDGLAQAQRAVRGEFTGHAGEWRFNYSRLFDRWNVQYDRDGDRVPDADILVTTSSGELTENNFILAKDTHTRPPAPSYLQLESLRQELRTEIARYNDGQLFDENGQPVRGVELSAGIAVFGWRDEDYREDALVPDLSRIDPDQLRLFVPLGTMMTVTASNAREVYAIATGETSEHNDLTIENFHPGKNWITALDLDGRTSAQSFVEGHHHTGVPGQWLLYRSERGGDWRAEYDEDGDGEPDHYVTIRPAYGRPSRKDFLLDDDASEPVASSYSPLSLLERINRDEAEIAQSVIEQVEAGSAKPVELGHVVLIFGNDVDGVSELPPALDTDTKPTLFIPTPSTERIITSDNPSVIAHISGFRGANAAVIDFQHGSDKFAALGLEAPQTVRRGTGFQKPNEWVYEESKPGALADHSSKKNWVVRFYENNDAIPDAEFTVRSVEEFGPSDFLNIA